MAAEVEFFRNVHVVSAQELACGTTLQRIDARQKMHLELEQTDKENITKSILEKYAKASVSMEGSFRYPTGVSALKTLGYDEAILSLLPESVQAVYCGVGNPFSLGAIDPGMAVIDIGCGAGVDTLIAALMVGPGGRAVGVDITPEMVERANKNLHQLRLSNVSFHQASAEQLDFPPEGFDVAISNGALNLVVNKKQALAEIYRVLKPGGRLMVADQILVGEPPQSKKGIVDSWHR
ncbi:MAG: methyltransferase domain-containing protein [Desulfobacterales bacterium]|nr:methyltransferase domain-containing protein [Desulfobacterales bacterium]